VAEGALPHREGQLGAASMTFGPECPDCGAKPQVVGGGTAIHPKATPRDYLRGLLSGNPPSCHITLWRCANSHTWQTPSREELDELWEGEWENVSA
jgi:hypothetical protein